MCDATYRVQEMGSYFILWTCDPNPESPWRLWNRIPGAGSGSWFTLETVMSDPRYIIWEVAHHGDCGHRTSGAGSWNGVTLETVDM